MRLRRVSTTAEEGVFTCNIAGDINTPRYLGVYYPSELLCSVYDERERKGIPWLSIFQVLCKILITHIHSCFAFLYRIAGNIGRELNLAD